LAKQLKVRDYTLKTIRLGHIKQGGVQRRGNNNGLGHRLGECAGEFKRSFRTVMGIGWGNPLGNKTLGDEKWG